MHETIIGNQRFEKKDDKLSNTRIKRHKELKQKYNNRNMFIVMENIWGYILVN